MRQPLGRLAVLFTLALMPACEEITDFPEGGVDVRAAHALPAVRTAAIDFTANIAIDNWSTRILYVDANCGWVIERLTGDTWNPAYRAACETTFAQEVQVAPQTSHIFTVTAFVVLREVAADLPSGTYRIVIPIEAEYSKLRRQPVPSEERMSNPFVVP